MMAAQAAMGSMDSPASQALPAMASRALLGTRAIQEYLERKALREKWVPQDWAFPASKASVVSLETPAYLDHQASRALLAPQGPQDK